MPTMSTPSTSGAGLPPGATLRHDLKPGDLEQIVRLHAIIHAEECGFDSTFEAYVAGPLAEFARGRTARDQLWITERDEQIVGCIAVVHVSQAEAQLRWFLVVPSARRRGLGRWLLHEAVEFARDRKYEAAFLWTVSALTSAARLYLRLGFEKAEERPGRMWGVDVVEEKYTLRLGERK
jgi:GNAT superfamily N-acetyltransferase